MNFWLAWIFFRRRARFIFSTASRLKFGYSQVYSQLAIMQLWWPLAMAACNRMVTPVKKRTKSNVGRNTMTDRICCSDESILQLEDQPDAASSSCNTYALPIFILSARGCLEFSTHFFSWRHLVLFWRNVPKSVSCLKFRPKISPTSKHVAKFGGDWPRDFRDSSSSGACQVDVAVSF